ncbi:metallophosphoesterase [Falsiroseomonas oryzae]|uniref:metallophosphoesterase n=1 Tax=Falsiroseomonas oryzae TaxID=2766473 RepID=UPI0022EB78B6|nr:metallophosphoesterase [Roseomonas sp. MO-31]
MPTRRGVLGTLAGLAAAGATGAAYAFEVEPGWLLHVVEHRVAPAGWPPGRSLTLGVIADLHAGGPHMPFRRVEAILEVALKQPVDLFLVLGDMTAGGKLTGAPGLADTTARLLGELRAPGGVHAVLGNHDWWEDAAVQDSRRGLPRFAAMLERAGIGVLHNDAVKVGGAWLAGLGSLWSFRAPGRRYVGTDDIGRALARVTDDDPVVLLCHEPDIFPRVPAGRVALTLSGHTHGGQVRILGHSPVVPSRYGNRYAYGHVVEDGKHLVVSGGIGTSIMPVRFGVPPEITLIRVGAA